MHKDATVCRFACTICSFRCHVAATLYTLCGRLTSLLCVIMYLLILISVNLFRTTHPSFLQHGCNTDSLRTQYGLSPYWVRVDTVMSP
jgi:hypothetical protein